MVRRFQRAAVVAPPDSGVAALTQATVRNRRMMANVARGRPSAVPYPRVVRFWELMSVCGADPVMLAAIRSAPEGERFIAWIDDFDRLVMDRDRERLDFEVPDSVCLLAFRASTKTYFLTPDGRLRWSSLHGDETEMSAVEVFLRFGGSVIEEVQEKGSTYRLT